MPRIRYRVTLTRQEREELETISTRGKHSSQKVLNALILLGSDEGPFQERKKSGPELAEVLPVSLRKLDRVKRRFVEDGFEAAVAGRKPERDYEKKADGDFEARLVALRCSEPPEGRARWSLRLLADTMVELGHVESVSYETVRRTLKKTS